MVLPTTRVSTIVWSGSIQILNLNWWNVHHITGLMRHLRVIHFFYFVGCGMVTLTHASKDHLFSINSMSTPSVLTLERQGIDVILLRL